MIYVFGDTHGSLELDKVTDYFEIECLQHSLTKEDYLIILGDAGICWDDGPKDEWVRQTLQDLPVTTLWLDGNHENFPLIQEYPEIKWHGGKVHQIAPDILHLMRGYCYEIDGKTFWTFGGGFSVDRAYRIQSINWWPEEMPSEEEYRRGMESLEKNQYKVDYILTHTAPRKVVEEICPDIMPGEESLQNYLQEVAEKTDFTKWYFGHWHMDVEVGEQYAGLLYNCCKIV